MRIAYLAYDSADNSVIQRVDLFRSTDVEVLGFMFRRERFNLDFVPDWDNVDLGVIHDGAFLRRLTGLVRTLPRIWRARRKLKGVSCVYARNLDLGLLGLFLCLLLPRGTPLVYEVLDIHRALLKQRFAGRLLRFLERLVLRRCDLLVVSSGDFIEHYFKAWQGYGGESFLLENKMSPNRLGAALSGERQERKGPVEGADGPWVLGWFGTLRCERSLELICALADALPDHVKVYLRGFPVRLGLEHFEAEIEQRPNIVFEGRYRNPEDLAEIYRHCDFNWCFDFVDPGANSEWLLPNRIYEGGYFDCPALAAAGSATGRKIEELALGVTFEAPYLDGMVEFFRSLTPERYESMVAKIAALERDQFCDDGQFGDLVSRIEQLDRAGTATRS